MFQAKDRSSPFGSRGIPAISFWLGKPCHAEILGNKMGWRVLGILESILRYLSSQKQTNLFGDWRDGVDYFSFYMSRVKKILWTLWLCLILEFLLACFLWQGAFSGRSRYIASPSSATSPADAKSVKLDSPLRIDARFVFDERDELTRLSGHFLTARNLTASFFRSCRVALMPSTIILAPKVSRCIFKSVLNL